MMSCVRPLLLLFAVTLCRLRVVLRPARKSSRAPSKAAPTPWPTCARAARPGTATSAAPIETTPSRLRDLTAEQSSCICSRRLRRHRARRHRGTRGCAASRRRPGTAARSRSLALSIGVACHAPPSSATGCAAGAARAGDAVSPVDAADGAVDAQPRAPDRVEPAHPHRRRARPGHAPERARSTSSRGWRRAMASVRRRGSSLGATARRRYTSWRFVVVMVRSTPTPATSWSAMSARAATVGFVLLRARRRPHVYVILINQESIVAGVRFCRSGISRRRRSFTSMGISSGCRRPITATTRTIPTSLTVRTASTPTARCRSRDRARFSTACSTSRLAGITSRTIAPPAARRSPPPREWRASAIDSCPTS